MSALTGLLVLVVAEVLTLVAVAERIGPLDAIGLLVILSACGPALLRRSGVGGIRRVAMALYRDGDVERVGVDAVIKMCGALLVCVPGYLTGIAGLAVWLPPVRSVVRRRLARRSVGPLIDTYAGQDPPASPSPGRRRRAVDVTTRPVDPAPPDR